MATNKKLAYSPGLEQQAHNRLIRPRSLYVGPAHRKYPASSRKSAA